MKRLKLIFFASLLSIGFNCSSEDDKKEKQCQKDRNILQLCLLINQNDARFCDTQSAVLYYNCGTAR